MFGRKDEEKQEKNEQWRQALQAEFDRLNSLPLAQLAAEVMRKGFGPDGPGADDEDVTVGQANINAGPSAAQIAGELVASRGFAFPVPSDEDLKLQGRSIRPRPAFLEVDCGPSGPAFRATDWRRCRRRSAAAAAAAASAWLDPAAETAVPRLKRSPRRGGRSHQNE